MLQGVLIHPSVFPSVSHFVVLAQASHWVFEAHGHYQKQTNRSRMYIYSPNGLQRLQIPIKHGRSGHQPCKEVQLEPAFDWQKNHFKSLEAAYRSTPYFEFFEDYFAPIYQKKYRFLWDLQLESMSVVCRCLGLPFHYQETTQYTRQPQDIADYRSLIDGKKDMSQFEPYMQIFHDKHGYINNLSIVDLLCHEGRHALAYLQGQVLPLVTP